VKVAFFLTAPNGGGAERAMIAVANYVASQGIAVDMVFGRPSGPYRDDIDSDVEVVDLGVDRLRKMLRPMSAYMRRAQPDVVVSSLMPCDVVMLLGGRLHGWKKQGLIISVQSHPVQVGQHSQKRLDRLWPFFIRRLYPGADYVVGISTGVAEATAGLLGRPAESVPVIHNPVIIPGFSEKASREPDHPWFHDDGPPVILSAGRLTWPKDYPTLLRAFARLSKRRDARLIIVGEGEERKRLEALIRELEIEDRVALPGFVSNPYAWMRRARLFALSSRWEGFGNVLAEALACGTPVVSTNCPSGPVDILNGGAFGTLVPVGDVEGLAQAMDVALDAPVDRDRLIARGMEFTVERIAPHYLDLIETVGAR
jgi:glycosyltransferase involved in cell wall biosynthesis